ncbi:hypothetical protein UFOVP1382_82 [uncultured Caudovirales phage]|uniref:Uncharacterized protein n=1 Tax=uncultured Caudovirales phage TaxID=2100421 RepID=A0A6J5S540_9CAUD|nr:hypothetical protein UFOVP1382_82 [uncultured Caudovirales phage]
MIAKTPVLRGDPFLTIKRFESDLSKWVVESWFAPAGGVPQAGLEMVQALEAAQQVIAECAKLGEPITRIDVNERAFATMEFAMDRKPGGLWFEVVRGVTLFDLPLRRYERKDA